MGTSERSRRDLYARLEEVLGTEHADALMTYIPPEPSAELATRADVAALGDRMNQLEDRFDRKFDHLNERFDNIQEALRDQLRTYTVIMVGAMTALTAIYAGLLVAIR